MVAPWKWTALLFACMAAACATFTVDIGQEFELPFQERARISGTGLSIEFTKLVSEGRCPAGVACGIRGWVVIEITVSHRDGRRRILTLNDVDNEIDGRQIFGLLIYLKHVIPWPEQYGAIPDHDYVATILVTHAR